MPYQQPYQEDIADQFDYANDWLELIDSTNEPGGGVSISGGSQEATKVGLIPWNKQRSAARYFMGFSHADTSSPYKLYREPPAIHPLWPSLRCSSITFAGYGVRSNQSNTYNSPFFITPFVGAYGEKLKTGYYKYALATVRYRSFGRMIFSPDSATPDYASEIKRYTRSTFEPNIQTLSVDGLSPLHFVEGPPGLTMPPTPFPAPLAALLAKANFSIVWHSVPHEYISSASAYLSPDNITECLGKLNSNSWLGFDPGTLLFSSMKAEEMLFPIVGQDPYDYPLTGWNIQLFFEYFQPPKGVPDSAFEGHRIFPWRQDRLFYYCETEGGQELLPSIDYTTITKNVWQP